MKTVLLDNHTLKLVERVNQIAFAIESKGGEGARNSAIFALWKLGYTQKQLAEEFDLSLGRVGSICKKVAAYSKGGF